MFISWSPVLKESHHRSPRCYFSSTSKRLCRQRGRKG